MKKNKYKEMKVNTGFITDNTRLINTLLKYENDTMTYNCSNYSRAIFAIENSIELLNEINGELEQGKLNNSDNGEVGCNTCKYYVQGTCILGEEGCQKDIMKDMKANRKQVLF